jgi:hypothetical protein
LHNKIKGDSADLSTHHRSMELHFGEQSVAANGMDDEDQRRSKITGNTDRTYNDNFVRHCRLSGSGCPAGRRAAQASYGSAGSDAVACRASSR